MDQLKHKQTVNRVPNMNGQSLAGCNQSYVDRGGILSTKTSLNPRPPYFITPAHPPTTTTQTIDSSPAFKNLFDGHGTFFLSSLCLGFIS